MPSQAAKKGNVPTSAVGLFARNFFKYPSMLGSIVPSSRFLVKDLMSEIDWDRARVLVEFGPGVGTITREVLKRMRPDAVLVVIELNEEFVQYLGVSTMDCIISGLPYSLLPEELRKEIVSESRQALKAEGSLLVFQFSPSVLPYLKSSFSSVKLGFQLLNILPARIFHCTP